MKLKNNNTGTFTCIISNICRTSGVMSSSGREESVSEEVNTRRMFKRLKHEIEGIIGIPFLHLPNNNQTPIISPIRLSEIKGLGLSNRMKYN